MTTNQPNDFRNRLLAYIVLALVAVLGTVVARAEPLLWLRIANVLLLAVVGVLAVMFRL